MQIFLQCCWIVTAVQIYWGYITDASNNNRIYLPTQYLHTISIKYLYTSGFQVVHHEWLEMKACPMGSTKEICPFRSDVVLRWRLLTEEIEILTNSTTSLQLSDWTSDFKSFKQNSAKIEFLQARRRPIIGPRAFFYKFFETLCYTGFMGPKRESHNKG